MSAIILSNITKQFPGSDVPSVNALSLTIKQGEFLCLLGPSGCGKSTTLRMVAGLETPTSGEIAISGTTVDDVGRGIRVEPEKRNLGFVFQNYALWPHMSVKDNVAFGPTMQKIPKKDIKHKVAEALRALAIDKYADRYPAELSGGQQQRVAIARTLAAKSQVLLLDEPLSNLDARLRLEMRSEFKRIHKETGATMVFVTHDQWEAMTLATRIVVMNEGSIQQVGTPLEIYNQPQNRFTAEFMGSPPINIVEREGSGVAWSAINELMMAEGLTLGSVGARPEDITFATKKSDISPRSLSFPVHITSIIPTGGSWIIEATEGSNRLFATTSSHPGLMEDLQVNLSVSYDSLHLFDVAGQRVEHRLN